MGLVKLRSKDRERALSTRHFVDKVLSFERDPDGLLAYCISFAKRHGVRIVEKRPSRLKLSKMTTTYYREIRVAVGFWGRGWSVARRAVVMAHEILHVLQWRFYGRVTFAMSYVGSARFRWAIEMQAYRFGVLVKRMLGYAERSIQDSIRHRASAMRKPYALGGLRWRDVKKYTPAVLNQAA